MRFFCTLSNGDSIITFIQKAYMKAIKVSPHHLHACSEIIRVHIVKMQQYMTTYIINFHTINVRFWYVGVRMEPIVCSWISSWNMYMQKTNFPSTWNTLCPKNPLTQTPLFTEMLISISMTKIKLFVLPKLDSPWANIP